MKRVVLFMGFLTFLGVGKICAQTVLGVDSIDGVTHYLDISSASHIAFRFESMIVTPRTGNDTSIVFSISDVSKVYFTETVATPYFTPGSGTYTEVQEVTIECVTEGATFYYTTDGTEPVNGSGTVHGTAYTTPITIDESTTLKAVAVKTGMKTSEVTTAYYSIETVVTGICYDGCQDVLLYPNPVYDFFSVEGIEEGKLSIYSLNGDEIMCTQYSSGSRVDARLLGSGSYLVRIGDWVGKIIKK